MIKYRFTNEQEEKGLVTINQPRADVIMIDPPWPQRGNKGAEKHYRVMPTSWIEALPVADLVKENSACFLWATNADLPDAIDILKGWGFTYRGYYFWAKAQMGLGYYFRNSTEIMLLGTKGRMLPDCKDQINWNLLPRQEHSKKPEEIYAIVERMYKHRDYIELFARERHQHPSWRIWGDQAEGGSDIFIPGCPVGLYSDKVTLVHADTLAPAHEKGA